MTSTGMTTRLVNIGDYRLSVDTTINDREGPAVVLVAGNGESSTDSFGELLPLLDGLPLVCYARPGLGESDPAPVTSPRGVGAAAQELHALLDAAEIQSPWVLVGHSFGALICEVFAAERPHEIAGLVLVDASEAQLFLDVGHPSTDGGDEPGTIPFDSAMVADDVIRSRTSRAEYPVAVVASRPGRWLDSKTPELWHPFTLAELDDRWQAN